MSSGFHKAIREIGGKYHVTTGGSLKPRSGGGSDVIITTEFLYARLGKMRNVAAIVNKNGINVTRVIPGWKQQTVEAEIR